MESIDWLYIFALIRIEMKLRGNYKWIRNLMVVSQLMLLGLVIQWLSSQYRQERELLVKELYTIYKTSGTAAMDSLLYRFIVSPVLADSSLRARGQVTVSKSIAVDSLQEAIGSDVPGKGFTQDSSIRVIGYGSMREVLNPDTTAVVVIRRAQSGVEATGGKEQMSVIITDTTRIAVRSSEAFYKLPEKESDMLMRSVRLIVSTDRDSVGKPGVFWQSVSRNIDTAMFIGAIARAVEEGGFNLDISVFADSVSDNTSLVAGPGLILKGFDNNIYPAVRVKGTVVEVVRNILAEILFGLLLLIMTASAFILSYRSLRSQIMINRIRDEFISNISHELKTPVATVKLALEAIEKFRGGLSDDTVSDYLNIASLETERLDRLVTKVLDYGRIEGGSNGLSLQRVDLMTVVKEAVETMKARGGGEGAIINLQGDDQLHLLADSLYLGGVLVNIMDNSLKYGIKPVVIDISVIRAGKMVTVMISDNGPGIPEEYIGKVFDKFFRVPSDNLHNVKGYGLGLSFARMVVESHGGTITARNNPEGGCSFIVSLPVND